MMKNERGFTIMELLVVIVIIGVLAAIGVPAYNNMTTRARQTACQANRHTIETGVMMYFAENAHYPTDLNKKTSEGGINEYLENVGSIACPEEGTYSTASGKVYCSVHKKATEEP